MPTVPQGVQKEGPAETTRPASGKGPAVKRRHPTMCTGQTNKTTQTVSKHASPFSRAVPDAVKYYTSRCSLCRSIKMAQSKVLPWANLCRVRTKLLYIHPPFLAVFFHARWSLFTTPASHWETWSTTSSVPLQTHSWTELRDLSPRLQPVRLN